jgi:hypothetical protein
MSTIAGIIRAQILTDRRTRLRSCILISERLSVAFLWFSRQFVAIIENAKNLQLIILYNDWPSNISDDLWSVAEKLTWLDHSDIPMNLMWLKVQRLIFRFSAIVSINEYGFLEWWWECIFSFFCQRICQWSRDKYPRNGQISETSSQFSDELLRGLWMLWPDRTSVFECLN